MLYGRGARAITVQAANRRAFSAVYAQTAHSTNGLLVLRFVDIEIDFYKSSNDTALPGTNNVFRLFCPERISTGRNAPVTVVAADIVHGEVNRLSADFSVDMTK